MTIDERLELLGKRHEALAQSVELLLLETRELRGIVEVDATNIRALARIAETHERRLALEGRPE
jgi:hypothetical protein